MGIVSQTHTIGKCEIRYKSVWENYISRLQTSFGWLIFDGTVKMKLAILTFLYCGEFVKTLLFSDIAVVETSCDEIDTLHTVMPDGRNFLKTWPVYYAVFGTASYLCIHVYIRDICRIFSPRRFRYWKNQWFILIFNTGSWLFSQTIKRMWPGYLAIPITKSLLWTKITMPKMCAGNL